MCDDFEDSRRLGAVIRSCVEKRTIRRSGNYSKLLSERVFYAENTERSGSSFFFHSRFVGEIKIPESGNSDNSD